MIKNTLIAQPRNKVGSAHSRRIRLVNILPANLLTGGVAHSIEILDRTAFTILLDRATTNNFEIQINDKRHLVNVTEVQRHPISLAIIHVDFTEQI